MASIKVSLALRQSVRRQILTKLGRLASPYPSVRERAAAEVSAALARRNLTWNELIIPAAENDNDQPASDWPAPALELLKHPDLTDHERADLRRLAAWRAPGQSGLERLRTIAERLQSRATG